MKRKSSRPAKKPPQLEAKQEIGDFADLLLSGQEGIVQVPDELKRLLDGSPLQALRNLFPGDKLERTMGLLSGIGYDSELVGLQIPEFARQASKQFWKYFFGRNFNATASAHDFGVILKVFDLVAENSQDANPPKLADPSLVQTIPFIAETLKKSIETLPDDQKAKLYAGKVRGKQIMDGLSPDYLKMQKRAPIYAIIAILWQSFAKFKSQAEAERWMRSKKIIGPHVESAEVRDAFRVIGLRYRGQGRPRKSENGGPASC